MKIAKSDPYQIRAYDFLDGLRKSAGKVETAFRGEKREWLPKSLALLTTVILSTMGNRCSLSLVPQRGREVGAPASAGAPLRGPSGGVRGRARMFGAARGA